MSAIRGRLHFCLFLHLFFCSNLGIQINITQGPSNITAYVGDSVTLLCHYTGTVDQPKWRIGGTAYRSSDPPAGYEPTTGGLHIPSVWVQLNNTVHVCFFTVFVASKERLEDIESQPAVITVRKRRKYELKRLLITLMLQILMPTADRNIERQLTFTTIKTRCELFTYTNTLEELTYMLIPTADRMSLSLSGMYKYTQVQVVCIVLSVCVYQEGGSECMFEVTCNFSLYQ